MKKIILTALLTVMFMSFGAYLTDIPVTVTQPDGTELNIFSSGDEFFNRLHDEDEYTIIQADNGWYYYGIVSDGLVVPSEYVAGASDPGSAGIQKNVVISEDIYKKRVEKFNNYPKSKDAPTTGTINNLVIFIRFADEAPGIFNRERSYYDEYFNKTEGPSLQHYFDEVSYQQLGVNSTYYPHVDDFATNLSYQDIYDRSYFQPYNASSNPDGYEGDSERTTREHELLERAVLAIADEVPTDLVIDGDNDGNVDNIVFLISGAPGAWSSLLWPHRWALYTKEVLINRKRVFDYNFDLTGTSTYFTVGVICHEFFHTLGAPDLYHYYDNTAPDAVGAWDVMNSTSNPPQYMGAWMKYKYGDWITDVPVISAPGTYTLNPLQSPVGNIYRINSPNSNSEFFVLEYRKQTGLYDSQLPGSEDGILIYRINSLYDGNADGPPDEVYIYRPGGTVDITGRLSNAMFSGGLGRTEFNLSSDPYPFLSNGDPGGVNITNISTAGETISFDIALNVNSPAYPVAAANYGFIELNWQEPDSVSGAELSHYNIYRDGTLLAGNVIFTTYQDPEVVAGEIYNYSITAYYSGDVNGESSAADVSVTYTEPLSAPYSNDISDITGWDQRSIECTPRWSVSMSSNAGGESPELGAELLDVNPATSIIMTPAISTTDIDTLVISFKHFYDSYSTGVTFKTEVSDDKNSWTSVGWENTGGGESDDIGPEEVEIILTEFPDPLYVGWILEGNLWNYDGWYIDDVEIKEKTPTSIEGDIIPSATVLRGNYPNPFNPETTISFALAQDSNVKINIYDMKGSLVSRLVSKQMQAGEHKVEWNGRDNKGSLLSSGIYYIRMTADGKNYMHKSIMIK